MPLYYYRIKTYVVAGVPLQLKNPFHFFPRNKEPTPRIAQISISSCKTECIRFEITVFVASTVLIKVGVFGGLFGLVCFLFCLSNLEHFISGNLL